MGSPYPELQVNAWSREQGAPRKRQVLTGAQTLTVAQSGALCLWNTAAGYTFTLPVITADDVGVWFEFLGTITNTSVAMKVITGAATSYIIGMPITYVGATTPAANPGPKGFALNGSSNIAIIMGGTDTTAGGVGGVWLRLTAISAVLWHAAGLIPAAGTIVTQASDT